MPFPGAKKGTLTLLWSVLPGKRKDALQYGCIHRFGVGCQKEFRLKDDDLVFALFENGGGDVKGVCRTYTPVASQIESVDPDHAADSGELDETFGDLIHFKFTLEEGGNFHVGFERAEFEFVKVVHGQ